MASSSKVRLFGAAMALFVAHISGQSSVAPASRVQVLNASFSPCPFDEASFSFWMEGETIISANTVSARQCC